MLWNYIFSLQSVNVKIATVITTIVWQTCCAVKWTTEGDEHSAILCNPCRHTGHNCIFIKHLMCNTACNVRTVWKFNFIHSVTKYEAHECQPLKIQSVY